jgi:hypothetical protein
VAGVVAPRPLNAGTSYEDVDEGVLYDIIHVTRPGKDILARTMAVHIATRIAPTGRPGPGG